MKELTASLPKPLLTVAGKSVLHWKLDALPAEIDEVIIVVKHHKEKIMAVFPNGTYDAPSGTKRIIFAEQHESRGTADALWAAQSHIRGPFISIMGDDIYPETAISDVVKSPTWAMTVVETDSFPDVFNIIPDERGFLKEAIQDDTGSGGKMLIDICLYKLTPDIFQTPMVQLNTKKEEFGLPHTVISHVMKNKIPVKIIRGDGWLKINSPADIAAAEVSLRHNDSFVEFNRE